MQLPEHQLLNELIDFEAEFIQEFAINYDGLSVVVKVPITGGYGSD